MTPARTDELLPCPFCGCADIRRESTLTDGTVWCSSCGGKHHRQHLPGSSGLLVAIGNWNTRASAHRSGVGEPTYKCLAVSKAACAWPDCGCDQHATNVIQALVDQGWQPPAETGHGLEEVRGEKAKRITGAVLATIKIGGDNLAIYQAVLGSLPVAQASMQSQLEEAGKAAIEIRNELDRVRADRNYHADLAESWKAQFHSAAAAASEYSEFWEQHHGEFDSFGNYIPYSQMDGDLRAAQRRIAELEASSVPSAKRVCAKCGCETGGEEALVDGAIWCHPCADTVAVPSTHQAGPHE